MSLKRLPVVLLLGAKSSKNPLPEIPKELSKLEMLFSGHKHSKPFFELIHLPYFTQDQLKTKLDRLAGRVAILHFAGHSDGKGLITDDEDDDQEMVYSHHIADHIRSWTQPPLLIFLNGCSNAEQVRAFHSAKVAVVIATHRAINDGKAAKFAREFYDKLFINPAQTSLQTAFEQASANLLMNKDGQFRAPNMDSLVSNDSGTLDWGLFPQHDDQLQWSLNDLITRERPILNDKGELVNPYKGLEAFQEEDKQWYFGRGKLIGELTETIFATNFYTLMGASGSGKSSLINAGVVPRLREAGNYSILRCSPGAEPFKELAKIFAQRFHPNSVSRRIREQKALTEDLQAQEIGVADLIEQLLDVEKSTHVFLLIDQFEELFTQSEAPVVQSYIAQLVALLNSARTDCTLILIMRADFLAAALADPVFAQLMDSSPHKLLSPMSEAELRQAIGEPAEKQGISIEPDLIEALLDAVENQAGSLPLLQHVLNLLWDKQQERTIRLADYIALGGMEEALKNRADDVYKTFTEVQQRYCQNVFIRLVQPGDGSEDTRRRAYLDEFTDDEKIIITTLADARLIMMHQSKKDGQAYTEVSHEALIRHWPLLREWIEGRKDEWRLQLQIIAAAKAWELHNREKDWLLTGSRLITAEKWLEENQQKITANEVTFIRASKEAHELTLLEKEKGILENNYLLAKVFEEKAMASIENGDTLTSDAQIFEYRKAWLYALESRKNPLPIQKKSLDYSTYGALSKIKPDSLNIKSELNIKKLSPTYIGSCINSLEISPDKEILAAAFDKEDSIGNNYFLLWSAISGAELARIEVDEKHSGYVSFSPDSNIVSVVGRSGNLYQWSTKNYLKTRSVTISNKSRIYSLAYSPNGIDIAFGVDDFNIKIFRLDSGNCEEVLCGHQKDIFSLIYSLDGKTLASLSFDGYINIWSVFDKYKLKNTIITQPISYRLRLSTQIFSFHPNGDSVALASDYDIKLINIHTGEIIIILNASHPYNDFYDYFSICSIAFSPKGEEIAAGFSDGTIRLWNIKEKKEFLILNKKQKENKGGIYSLKYHVDGKSIISGSAGGNICFWSILEKGDGILNPNNEEKYGAYTPPVTQGVISMGSVFFSEKMGEICKLAYHVNGSEFAISSRNNSILLCESGLDEAIRILYYDEILNLTSLAYNPRGRNIASGFSDGTLCTWDVHNGVKFSFEKTHNKPIKLISYSKDGSLLASASSNGVVSLWASEEANSCKYFLKDEIEISKIIIIIRFNSDENLFITCQDGSVFEWGISFDLKLRSYNLITDDWQRSR